VSYKHLRVGFRIHYVFHLYTHTLSLTHTITYTHTHTHTVPATAPVSTSTINSDTLFATRNIDLRVLRAHPRDSSSCSDWVRVCVRRSVVCYSAVWCSVVQCSLLQCIHTYMYLHSLAQAGTLTPASDPPPLSSWLPSSESQKKTCHALMRGKSQPRRPCSVSESRERYLREA
jgi:hypothetical protein